MKYRKKPVVVEEFHHKEVEAKELLSALRRVRNFYDNRLLKIRNDIKLIKEDISLKRINIYLEKKLSEIVFQINKDIRKTYNKYLKGK